MSKETALVPQYGPTVNDAELVYWNGLTGGAHKNVKEAKHAFFDSQGIPWSVLNDREYRYLSTQFGAGTYNDLEEKYWQSGGSPIAAAVGTLSSTGRKGVLPGSAANRFWWRDRNRTQPWDIGVDLERTVEFVDCLTANPVGWSLGPDLLVNGSFSNGLTGWTNPDTAPCTTTHSNGAVLFTVTSTGICRLRQQVTVVVGKRYRVSWSVLQVTGTPSLALTLGVTTSGDGAYGATSCATAGRYSVNVLATATMLGLAFTGANAATGTALVDDVRVEEVVINESWLGANLVTNGDFSNGTTGWSGGFGGSTIANVSGALEITGSGGAFPGARQTLTTVAGTSYRVTATLRRGTSASVAVISPVSPSGFSGSTSSTSDEAVSFVFAATASTTQISVFINSATGTGTIYVDNITVREIPGHPIVSAVSGSGLVGSKRVNLASQTEFRNGLTDAPTRTGLISLSSMVGYAAAIAFGHDGTTLSYAYKTLTLTGSTSYRITAIVQMDDGLPPVFGSTTTTSSANDFVFSVGGAVTNMPSATITNLGGGVYRVSLVTTSVASPNTFIGVAKFATNSSRTFKVTAYDLRLALWDSFNLPPYQRVNDGTAGVFDYDDTAGVLHLKNVTGTQAMMTLGTVDMTAGDAGVLLANVVKLSDAATAVIAEFSTNSGSTAGSVGLLGPNLSVGAANYAERSFGSAFAQAVATGHGAPAVSALIGTSDISSDVCRIQVNGVQTNDSTDQGTGNLGNHRLNIAARDAGGTASLRFTGYYIGNFPALFAGDAGLNPLSLSREYAAQGGFVY